MGEAAAFGEARIEPESKMNRRATMDPAVSSSEIVTNRIIWKTIVELVWEKERI